ncbi:MAG TPA: LysR substrate-binding domain-containing protein [Terriglobales bacterium]|nr:LysR substrate-binding domain-containing protein [Terriglobales bacterium]
MPHVELRHARYFVAVAECLNFRQAAQQLHLAQPPLSRQIRQLEEYLGVSLFVRDKRKVELTKAGHAFLEEARKLIMQAGHAADVARHTQKGEVGTVRIGLSSGLGGTVSKVVFEHRRRQPAIEVECRDIFSSFQNEALRRQEIDVGFMRPPVDELNLDCEALYEEEFFVIIPRTHRLAKRRSVRLRDIAEEPLIGFNRKLSGLQDKMMGMFNRQGFAPHVVVTPVEAHEEAGAIMVATGKAVFVGPSSILNHSVPGLDLASVRLNEPEANIQVYAAWRKGEDSRAVLGFLESIRPALSPQMQKKSA